MKGQSWKAKAQDVRDEHDDEDDDEVVLKPYEHEAHMRARLRKRQASGPRKVSFAQCYHIPNFLLYELGQPRVLTGG